MKRRASVFFAILSLALASAAPAFAGDDTIFSGSVGGYPGASGPRHSLNRVSGNQMWGQTICLNALNDAAGTWAGTTRCSTGNGSYVDHVYCACVLRRGYAWGPTTYGIAQQWW